MAEKNGRIISVPFIEYYISKRLFERPDKPQELTFSDDQNAPELTIYEIYAVHKNYLAEKFIVLIHWMDICWAEGKWN